MEYTKEYSINNSVVKIIFGNILNSTAEVIVSSDDSMVSMGGGVSRAIRKSGGSIIRDDARTKIPAAIGDVVVTTAGQLRQKYVFHCITIDRNFSRSNASEVLPTDFIQQYIIGHSINKCFQLIQAMELGTVAFPSIGAGVAGIPFDLVARVMSETIARNLMKTNRSIGVEIYLFDRFNRMDQWDFLPMFEQFSTQEALSKLQKDQTYDRLYADDVVSQGPQDIIPSTDKEVFISYSRKDGDAVKPIYDQLEKAGYKCWLDVDGMYSGVSYKKVIVDAIKQSKVLLFMSSENSNKSRNVVSEVSLAMEYGKKIIPVRFDNSSYDESIEYDLINYDYVTFDHSRVEESCNEVLKKLVATMKMLKTGNSNE